MPNWYASTYYDGEDYASVLVKTRRPPHPHQGQHALRHQPQPRFEEGSINARINSSVMSLYDNERVSDPMMKSGEKDWTTTGLAHGRQEGDGRAGQHQRASGSASCCSPTRVISPSAKQAIELFRTGSVERPGRW